MTRQEKAVTDRFKVVQRHADIVRLTKGADARLVRKDGTVKRAQHVIRRVSQ